MKILRRSFSERSDFWAFALWALGLFWIAPGLHGLDSSELALASATFGVGHPPGQLSHVLLTRAIQFLPIGDLAFRANLFSFLCTLVSAWILRAIVATWTKNDASFRSVLVWVGVIAALSPFVFLQSVRTEVYALSSMFALMTIWLMAQTDRRYHGIGAFVFGLCLLNHPVMAVAALPFVRWRRAQVWIWMAVPSMLLVYFPIRSANPGVWNFGHAETLPRLIEFLTGDLYARAPHAQFSWVDHLRSWGWALAESVPMGLMLLAVGGTIELAISRARDLLKMSLGAGLVVFLLLGQSNYWANNPDAQGYQSILVWFVALLGGYGFAVWIRQRRSAFLLGVSFLALAAIQAINYPDLSAYAKDTVSSHQMAYLMNETEEAKEVYASSFFTYALLSYGQRVEGRRVDAAIFYRGDRAVPRVLPGAQAAIELLIDQNDQGRYTLGRQDRAWVLGGMDCSRWFCFAPVEGGRSQKHHDDFIRQIASNLHKRQEFVKEPFVLNAIVRILAARLQGDLSMEQEREKELFFLFPEFAEYNLLEKNP